MGAQQGEEPGLDHLHPSVLLGELHLQIRQSGSGARDQTTQCLKLRIAEQHQVTAVARPDPEHHGLCRDGLRREAQLIQVPATHLGAARVVGAGEPLQPVVQARIVQCFSKWTPFVLSEGDTRGKPGRGGERADGVPGLQAALRGQGPQDLLHQVGDRLDITQRRVRAALGQPVVLTQGLQLVVPGRHRVQQTLSQAEGAETGMADGLDTKPLPLRTQHLVEVVAQVVGDQRLIGDVLGEGVVDLKRRLAVALQDLTGVAVDAGGLGRNVGVVIEQATKGRPFRCPSAHALGRKFHDIDRRLDAGGFGVEENPGGSVHLVLLPT